MLWHFFIANLFIFIIYGARNPLTGIVDDVEKVLHATEADIINGYGLIEDKDEFFPPFDPLGDPSIKISLEEQLRRHREAEQAFKEEKLKYKAARNRIKNGEESPLFDKLRKSRRLPPVRVRNRVNPNLGETKKYASSNLSKKIVLGLGLGAVPVAVAIAQYKRNETNLFQKNRK